MKRSRSTMSSMEQNTDQIDSIESRLDALEAQASMAESDRDHIRQCLDCRVFMLWAALVITWFL